MNPAFEPAHPVGRSDLRGPPRDTAERQSLLLDDALLETFPASDPVSVLLAD